MSQGLIARCREASLRALLQEDSAVDVSPVWTGDREAAMGRVGHLGKSVRPTMQSLAWHGEVSEVSEPCVALVSEGAGIKRRHVTVGTHWMRIRIHVLPRAALR